MSIAAMPEHDSRFDLLDPRWFPVNYLKDKDQFRFKKIDIRTIGDSSFLDDRMNTLKSEEILLAAETEFRLKHERAPAFLFHTAFCGSTLLARALHSPPEIVSLKEPSVLLDLSSPSLITRFDITPNDLHKRLESSLKLLGRPWTLGGRILIKPTNQVNRIIPQLLHLEPKARAVLLYSTLDEFLVSCFKKLPLAETRIRWMAQHLLVGSDLAVRLGIPVNYNFSLPESCVFSWYCQIERYAKALDSDTADRLRTLDFQMMLKNPMAAVSSAASWLDLPGAENSEQRIINVFRYYSKAPGKEYSLTHREAENKATVNRFGDVIFRTIEWAKRNIEPGAVMPQSWRPLI
jgi:hypothetical protein